MKFYRLKSIDGSGTIMRYYQKPTGVTPEEVTNKFVWVKGNTTYMNNTEGAICGFCHGGMSLDKKDILVDINPASAYMCLRTEESDIKPDIGDIVYGSLRVIAIHYLGDETPELMKDNLVGAGENDEYFIVTIENGEGGSPSETTKVFIQYDNTGYTDHILLDGQRVGFDTANVYVPTDKLLSSTLAEWENYGLHLPIFSAQTEFNEEFRWASQDYETGELTILDEDTILNPQLNWNNEYMLVLVPAYLGNLVNIRFNSPWRNSPDGQEQVLYGTMNIGVDADISYKQIAVLDATETMSFNEFFIALSEACGTDMSITPVPSQDLGGVVVFDDYYGAYEYGTEEFSNQLDKGLKRFEVVSGTENMVSAELFLKFDYQGNG